MQGLKPPTLSKIETRKANPELIRYCELLLDWAKRGDLRAVTGVCQWQGFSMSTLDCGRDGRGLRTLVGQLEVVKMQVLDEIIAKEQEIDDEAS